ncbi:hypothetical protein SLE2022_301320 [Rubroshorea leprosula]
MPCLPWKQRLQICIDAARGLHYLHKECPGRIIHRDIKSTNILLNILLNENLIAKVAGFEPSKSALMDQTSVSTWIKAAFGYLDPEHFQTQQLTEKSDVYSFGVVLLEMLCARPAIISGDPQLPMKQVNLAEWGLLCHRKGVLETIVDPSVKDQINLNSLRIFAETTEKCLLTTEKCLLADGANQPSMTKPHEDSNIEATSGLRLVNVQRLPSLSLQIERDDVPILRDSTREESFTSASEVFSQLRINHAR